MKKKDKKLDEVIKFLDDIIIDITKTKQRQKLILSGLRNVLFQNNPNGVNNYLIKLIEREL